MTRIAPPPEEMDVLRAAVPESQRALFEALKAEVDENQDEANENQEYLTRINHWQLALAIGVGFLVALAVVKIFFFGVVAAWG